jgi:putative solute:sodium symporter small subunit
MVRREVRHLPSCNDGSRRWFRARPGHIMSEQDEMNPAAAPGADSVNEVVEGQYWKANLRLLGILMTIWFVVSFGAGVLLRDWLDLFRIGGYPLGFWFAQQGSIYVFVALIFYYSHAMRRLERKYDLED